MGLRYSITGLADMAPHMLTLAVMGAASHMMKLVTRMKITMMKKMTTEASSSNHTVHPPYSSICWRSCSRARSSPTTF